MEPIQVILIIILIFAMSRVWLRAQEGTIALGEIFFWIGIFSAAMVGVIDPNFTTFVAQKLGIDRGTDAVLYISLILLFYLTFRTNVHMENLRHENTKLVRELALFKKEIQDLLKEKKKSK